MGGFNQPSQTRIDPLAGTGGGDQLRNNLFTQMNQLLGGGQRQPSPSPFPGLTNPVEQLFGGGPPGQNPFDVRGPTGGGGQGPGAHPSLASGSRSQFSQQGPGGNNPLVQSPGNPFFGGGFQPLGGPGGGGGQQGGGQFGGLPPGIQQLMGMGGGGGFQPGMGQPGGGQQQQLQQLMQQLQGMQGGGQGGPTPFPGQQSFQTDQMPTAQEQAAFRQQQQQGLQSQAQQGFADVQARIAAGGPGGQQALQQLQLMNPQAAAAIQSGQPFDPTQGLPQFGGQGGPLASQMAADPAQQAAMDAQRQQMVQNFFPGGQQAFDQRQQALLQNQQQNMGNPQAMMAGVQGINQQFGSSQFGQPGQGGGQQGSPFDFFDQARQGGFGQPPQGQQSANPGAAFDFQQFGGPFSAPLTGGQQDALAGFSAITGNNPIINNQQISQALQTSLGGNPAFGPGQGSFGDAVQGFELPSAADPFFGDLFGGGIPGQTQAQQIDTGQVGTPEFGNQNLATSGFIEGQGGTGGAGGGAQSGPFGEILSTLQPDIINSFQSALDPGAPATGGASGFFQGALDRAIGAGREEAGAFGLNPGALDRGQILAGNAAEVGARFGIDQQNADTAARQQNAQARIGGLNAINAIPNVFNQQFQNEIASRGAGVQEGSLALQELLGRGDQNLRAEEINQRGRLGQRDLDQGAVRNQLGGLGNLFDRENIGADRFLNTQENSANRAQQTLGNIPGLQGIPANDLLQLFGINEAARGVADQDITRRRGDFNDARGGQLQQFIQMLQGSPLPNTAMGPSGLSQLSGLLGSLGGLIPGLGG